jgi:hypothetical protein
MPEDLPSRDAIRFTYVYDGADIQLVAADPVDMITPPSHPIVPGSLVGFWYEITDETGQPLWRRMRSHPLGPTVESMVDPESEANGYERGTPEPPSGTFTLVVPSNIVDARFVFLVGTPPDGPADAPAVVLFGHVLEPFLL